MARIGCAVPRSSKVLLSGGTTTTRTRTTTAVEVAVLEEGKGPWSKAPIIRLRERGGTRWGGGGAARRKLIIVHFSSAALAKRDLSFLLFAASSPFIPLQLFFLPPRFFVSSSTLSLSVYIRNVAFDRPFVVGSPLFRREIDLHPRIIGRNYWELLDVN